MKSDFFGGGEYDSRVYWLNQRRDYICCDKSGRSFIPNGNVQTLAGT